jgi:hypothetical protein
MLFGFLIGKISPGNGGFWVWIFSWTKIKSWVRAQKFEFELFCRTKFKFLIVDCNLFTNIFCVWSIYCVECIVKYAYWYLPRASEMEAAAHRSIIKRNSYFCFEYLYWYLLNQTYFPE